MRILHLLSSHRWTGAAEPATDLAREQLRLGHEVRLACVRGASLEEAVRERGVPMIESLHLQPGAHPIHLAADFFTLRRLQRELKFDAIHAHLPHAHWLACAAMGRLNPFGGKPDGPLIVRTIHRDQPQRADPVHKFFFGRATDLLITVSRAGRDSAVNRLGVGEDHVAWIPGAVDLERFRADLHGAPTRKKWKIAPEDLVVGMVAEMQPHRGHHLLIDTIEEVAASAPRARYAFVGSGELKRKLKARIKSHALRGRFTWFGVRTKDLPEVYSTMNVCALLAQGSDGTCRAMLEAMASGIPVIGARVGAIAETIQPGRTGWLIDPTSPETLRSGLAMAIKEALADPERTAEMGREARRFVETEFTQRLRADRTLAAYAQAGSPRSITA